MLKLMDPDAATGAVALTDPLPDMLKCAEPAVLIVPDATDEDPEALTPTVPAADVAPAELTDAFPEEFKLSDPYALTVPDVTIDVPDACKLMLPDAAVDAAALTVALPDKLKPRELNACVAGTYNATLSM